MKKEIRVKSKLVVREVKRQDTPTKIGLGVAFGFILPCLVMIAGAVANGASASFGLIG